VESDQDTAHRDAFERHLDQHQCGTGDYKSPHYIGGFIKCPEAMSLWKLLPDDDQIILALRGTGPVVDEHTKGGGEAVITKDYGWVIVNDPIPGQGYEDDEDEWANLFERDDRTDVYDLFGRLRDERV
jgi:hypothetical protein